MSTQSRPGWHSPVILRLLLETDELDGRFFTSQGVGKLDPETQRLLDASLRRTVVALLSTRP